ncbi:Putative transcriptional regulator, TetR family OS=Tsukamurella paurometabola (strain ATCC 8368 /DSM / CCUG 35730 / CIP 100753 / JCM 10117 / KCTC 9821/ NBRC 16120 / NCIMB 702349 / NCTC 13040) OX=521096 GN=Tpau_3625 PE=4 SV=1 [Tsukamurella paurometabola]|uniref:Putative transcriptional regulator, TetR family n=1 Tax=Tsukamurella paurometabola (strain ATCC 8368 / DSM 20162 / CCUG 35730 / CIP 100753 / JCM 10117 / KCTC 9821 / NBRC 16120 / NCIMB 702349 / NCTC 13040) TaxID=521096 RepID=D5UXW6_TSUPD|nr:TetR family transcriptional regulator [Tsukamurella paurometabola]ADG80203.1 putative transcriptional regulator, TetR family [Tsukamurella paurometabola DSM 20162]SUP38823.1 putative DNA-binding transcriptional regulator [Tsukamurella paurometabola]
MSKVTAATTPKGERRRAALVAAAGELLVEGGFESVRHRAVAHRAHIPLAATTYYFESLGDLLSNAVAYAGDHDIAAVRARVDGVSRRRRGDAALARLIATVFFACESEAERSALVSRYERLVVCTRDPHLAQMQAQVRGTLAELHVEVLDRSGRRTDRARIERLMAIEDGAALAAFTDHGTDVARAVRDAVAAVIDDLAAPLP